MIKIIVRFDTCHPEVINQFEYYLNGVSHLTDLNGGFKVLYFKKL